MTINITSTKETLAIAYGSAALFASLHTAQPSQGTPAEVSGGAPAYARKSLTWTAGGSDGVVNVSATFDVPTGTTVTHAGLWSATSAGTLVDWVQLTSQTFNSQGQLTVNFTYTQS
jgi:hypothetical protein